MKHNKNTICHCRGCSLQNSAISTLLEKRRDPRLQLSGMTHVLGFTLIELLVVVLIIGILSAIALPKYQKSVIKTRVATIMPFGAALAQAKEVYYMEHGEYVRDVEVLGIELPKNCTRDPIEGTPGYYSCGAYFVLDNNPGNVSISYCPRYADSWRSCYPKRDFMIVFSQQHQAADSQWPAAGQIYCNVNHSSKLGKSVCKSFPEFIYSEKM